MLLLFYRMILRDKLFSQISATCEGLKGQPLKRAHFFYYDEIMKGGSFGLFHLPVFLLILKRVKISKCVLFFQNGHKGIHDLI